MKKESHQNNICEANDREEELYIPEANLNRIAVIDTVACKIVRYILVDDIPVLPFGSRPTLLVAIPDGSKIYSDNFGLITSTVSVINRLTETVKSVIINSLPLGIFNSSNGKELYITEENHRIEVICTETDEIVRCLHFENIPTACACGSNGNLYIGFANGTLGVYNSFSGNMLWQPLFSEGTRPSVWLTLNADEKKLYAGNADGIEIIDTANWKRIKSIPIREKDAQHKEMPCSFTAFLSPDGKKLYVTLTSNPGVTVIDMITDKIIKTIETTGLVTGIAFSSTGKRGYFSEIVPGMSVSKTIEKAVLEASSQRSEITPTGQVTIFDTETDDIIGKPIIIGSAAGIPVLVPYISSYLIF
ncbi:40-residue YVTN family beta-propeller repeat-containing protein [Chryseobacterium wanjuense]|uniref:40-residue YVTN family beta-propeller repeat-containing protein n=1 Tax=Chryseobacterium wanjuense TaxID=356305 RepID=A0A1I0QJB7_9FLAO|nr:YncE family protein [Chryseobacterium wanjuense]SEW26765.1 40-residue YVTN family beta-propeller repeat-containing protein [Chryseobacterium wanjuense]